MSLLSNGCYVSCMCVRPLPSFDLPSTSFPFLSPSKLDIEWGLAIYVPTEPSPQYIIIILVMKRPPCPFPERFNIIYITYLTPFDQSDLAAIMSIINMAKKKGIILTKLARRRLLRRHVALRKYMISRPHRLVSTACTSTMCNEWSGRIVRGPTRSRSRSRAGSIRRPPAPEVVKMASPPQWRLPGACIYIELAKYSLRFPMFRLIHVEASSCIYKLVVDVGTIEARWRI